MSYTTIVVCCILYAIISGLFYQILVKNNITENIIFIPATILCFPYSWGIVFLAFLKIVNDAYKRKRYKDNYNKLKKLY